MKIPRGRTPAANVLSDRELLDLARNDEMYGPLFVALYDRSDILKYLNQHDSDETEAVTHALQDLIKYLAIICNNKKDRIESLLKKSVLYQAWANNAGWDAMILRWISETVSNNDACITIEASKQNETQTGEAKPTKEPFSIAALASELSESGLRIRFNDITCRYDIDGQFNGRECDNLDRLRITVFDALRYKYKGADKDTIKEYLTVIGYDNKYNPVLEYLDKLTWDKKDHINDLCEVLHISYYDDLSRMLLRKWLYQAVALLFNDDKKGTFGGEGVLTFTGDQRFGKTSFFHLLALNNNEWVSEGKLSKWDKDHERRIVTCWITELGEVGKSIRDDLDDMKSFITRGFDVYRLPYGHVDVRRPRRSSIGATCNDQKYLVDETGNRRFWTIDIKQKVEYADLSKFDFAQLWAQVYAYVAPLDYKEKAACFRLTDDEQRQLADRNAEHETSVKALDEVKDVLDRANRYHCKYEEMDITAFKNEWPDLRNYSSEAIGKALSKCGIKPSRDGQKRTRLLPVNPGHSAR